MNYSMSFNNPSTHYIDIKIETKTEGKAKLRFQLPAWRPGRYELGNFAKNIQKWQAFDESDNVLSHQKISKDLWEVNCDGASIVRIVYNYFANELNAGSTFLSEEQLYVNPVNCLFYEESKTHEICELELMLPSNFKVATSMESVGNHKFQVANFDELADSPFIASAALKHHEFKVEETKFHLWFQGEFKANWELLEKDFKAYTLEQIKLFGDFPTSEYHYLFQILPFTTYHGVEHSASTVIALGPSYDVLRKDGKYQDLLGVSSHELFHTWNVKRIRPVEMIPYDFSKENYTRLGYLTEGVTTWYGDLMLYRSKVFGDVEYFKTFNQLLDRHNNNPGVLNLSVADSSFDTWLDGYVMGVPNRKASIYAEGALITFLLDVEIRRSTNNENSFDEVMKSFYHDYYKNGKGISEEDYKKVIEEKAGKNLDDFFDKYVNGSEDITEKLNESLAYLGLQHTKNASSLFHEAFLGVRLNGNQVLSVYPNSPAEQAGISVQDKLITINSLEIKNDLSQWLEYFNGDSISLGLINAQGVFSEVIVELSDEILYSKNSINWVTVLSEEQKVAKDKWITTK